MDRRDLNRMFDALAPTQEQEQVVLDRLLQTERKGRPMRKVKKLTVFAVAAALMVISCTAAVVTGLDQRLLDYFGAKSEEDVELVAPAAVAVDQSHTYENGWTVEIRQVLADRLSLAVLVDVTAPEGTVLNRGSHLTMALSQLNDQGERLSGQGVMTGRVTGIEDDDPADNRITELWQFRRALREDSLPFPGSAVKVTPMYMSEGVGGKRLAQFKDEFWSCTVELPDVDLGTPYEIGQPLSIGEKQFTLSSVYLSPLGITVSLADGPDKLWSEETEMIWPDWEDNFLINMTDGTQLAAAEPSAQRVSRNDQGGYTGNCTFLFDQILNPEEIVSVTLFGQTYELN